MQTHYLPKDLPWGRRTRAYWATQPNKTLVVFVHGFAGKAVDSWTDFAGLLTERPQAAGCDLVFYGYDSLRRPMQNSALQLLEFLDVVHKDPGPMLELTLDASAQRDAKFRYDRLVLVGHSLGAVVARRALVDAHRDGRAWAPKTHLVLFAPAHSGAQILEMATSVMGAFKVAPVETIAKWLYPVLDDLKLGSPALAQLKDDVREAIQAGGAEHLRAKLVVISDNDEVVRPERFFCDPVSRQLSRGHIDICKPDAVYTDPVDLLVGIL
jgi:pimeloyl-ACP methyl ester carboxylesterase